KYQKYTKKLKSKGYIVTGYCGKFRSTIENTSKRIHSLQEQIRRLKIRSLLVKAHVLISCDFNKSIMNRNLK
ncbi:MAG: hypothetical protein EXX96DRAFT_449279, partial [Benjaminiella poitrasii]